MRCRRSMRTSKAGRRGGERADVRMSDETEPTFIRVQREFTRYLRDPEHAPLPAGVPEAGAAVYRNAVFANIDRFMTDNFPRVRAVMDDTRWAAMVRDYFLRHRSDTPLFVELPGEFLAYLEHERNDTADPPYLYELAHFDSLENVIGADERLLDFAGIAADGDLMRGELAINPIHQLVTYAYPVHVIDAAFRPDAAPGRPTQLLAFRDREYRYGILDLNPLSARLFLALRDAGGRSAETILREIAHDIGHADPAVVLQGGLEIIARMRARDLILGVRIRRRSTHSSHSDC